MACKEPIYFAKDGRLISVASPAPNYANGDFNFDLPRMKQAVEAPRVSVPTGMSPEELMAWLDGLTEDDFVEQA